MSLITCCPACGTKFRVVADQLRISDGWVRCGRCQEVFDAQLALHKVTPAVTHGPAQAQPPASAVPQAPPAASAVVVAQPRTRASALSIDPPPPPAPSPSQAAQAPAAPGYELPVPPDPPDPPDEGGDAAGPEPDWEVLPSSAAKAEPVVRDLRAAPVPDLPSVEVLRSAAPAAAGGMGDVEPVWDVSGLEFPDAAAATGPIHAEVEAMAQAFAQEMQAGGALGLGGATTARARVAARTGAALPSPAARAAPVAPVTPAVPVVPVVPVAPMPPVAPATPVAPPTPVSVPVPVPSPQASPTPDLDFSAPVLPASPAPAAPAAPVADEAPASTASKGPSGLEGTFAVGANAADVDADADADAAAEAAPGSGNSAMAAGPGVPEFMKQAQRKAWWSQPEVRFVMGMLVMLLPLALALQVVVQERNALAAWQPAWRPALENLCVALGCTLAPRQDIAAVVVSDSHFAATGVPFRYQFELSLHNRSGAAVAMPALEVTLTDNHEQVLVRKVLQPHDLGAPTELGPRAEWSAKLPVSTEGLHLPVSGYRLTVFYP